jgi:hypothetical protein
MLLCQLTQQTSASHLGYQRDALVQSCAGHTMASGTSTVHLCSDILVTSEASRHEMKYITKCQNPCRLKETKKFAVKDLLVNFFFPVTQL